MPDLPTAPSITIVVARATNGVIGRNNALPWHVPGDLKRFKALTLNSSLIMGRKTFESLPGLLPGRRHIVLTRDTEWQAPGVEVANDTASALALAGGGRVSVIGGAEIIALFEPIAHCIELTEVLADVDGDVTLADPRTRGDWRETAREDYPATPSTPAWRTVTLVKATA